MINLAARVPRVPRTCVWDLTTACNLRCIHCEVDAGHAAKDEMSTGEMLALADDLAAAGCRSASLTGGEPLLRADWPVVARRLADHGVDVKIVTNGVLLDRAVLGSMIESGVKGVAVSIDGPREVHDLVRVPAARMGSRYDAAIRAIELVVASGLKTAVITQVHGRNVEVLGDMYETLAGLGVDAWQVQLAFPMGRMARAGAEWLVDPASLPSMQARLASLARHGRTRIVVADNIGYYGPDEPGLRMGLTGSATFWTGCMAGVLGVAISSTGDVKGCPSQPTSFVVGNVRKEPFAAIWADGHRFSYNTEWRAEGLEGGCARCAFNRLCRAGCRTMAFAVTGTIHDNPMCVQRAR